MCSVDVSFRQLLDGQLSKAVKEDGPRSHKSCGKSGSFKGKKGQENARSTCAAETVPVQSVAESAQTEPNTIDCWRAHNLRRSRFAQLAC